MLSRLWADSGRWHLPAQHAWPRVETSTRRLRPLRAGRPDLRSARSATAWREQRRRRAPKCRWCGGAAARERQPAVIAPPLHERYAFFESNARNGRRQRGLPLLQRYRDQIRLDDARLAELRPGKRGAVFAMRGWATAPDHGVAILGLPTGYGKSELIALAPFLFGSRRVLLPCSPRLPPTGRSGGSQPREHIPTGTSVATGTARRAAGRRRISTAEARVQVPAWNADRECVRARTLCLPVRCRMLM
jgi:hypothetical protein